MRLYTWKNTELANRLHFPIVHFMFNVETLRENINVLYLEFILHRNKKIQIDQIDGEYKFDIKMWQS